MFVFLLKQSKNDTYLSLYSHPNLMLALYNSYSCAERASILAAAIHAPNYQVLNAQVVQLGKRIVKKMPHIIYPTMLDELPRIRNIPRDDLPIMYKYIPFQGEDNEDHPGHFIWIMRPELSAAIKALIRSSKLNNDELIASEIPNSQASNLCEGALKQIVVNAYERNRKARSICINVYGYKCFVCGFNFEKEYGKIGANFIEVHHIAPLHKINKNYCVDPVRDLRPVCPNCHAMLHKANLSVEELQKILSAKLK